jgi:Tfp pilus assembly protein PilZ
METIDITARERSSLPKPRVPFTSKVWYRLPQAKKAVASVGANLSESGIFVQTTDPPKVGSRIGLQFFVNGSDEPVEAVAQVVWVKPFEPINIDGLLPGMGARFLTIGGTSVDLIRNFVDQSTPRPLPPTPETATDKNEQDANGAQSIALEHPMVLQLTGDHEPIFGYSTEVGHGSMNFCTDFVPKESVANGLENKSASKKVRGCIGIPVEIDQIARQKHGSADPKQLTMSLDFTELREELIKVRPRLKTNADQSTNLPSPVAKITEIRPPSTVTPTGISVATVTVIGMGLFALGLLFGTLFQ